MCLLLPSPSFADCPKEYTCSKTLTMFGQDENKEPDHFDYVNPAAPKGGKIKFAASGTFDSLNPFILKGIPAAGISSIYDSLMTSSGDDIFTRYGLLADGVKMAKDKRSIIFVLNKKAKWHDGKPILAEDVVFTFNTLTKKGNPFFASYYRDVEKVEALSLGEVKFTFKTAENRELPFIVSEMAILPKHYWEGKDFEAVNLDVPLGSGAYKVGKVDAGRSISYDRVKDYWGAELAPNIGQNNFDIMQHDYYRDDTVMVEGLKAGGYDVRQENIARVWATSYDIPAVKDGRLKKVEIPHQMSTGMQAFVPNLRREKFQDIKVREALELAFDFEWENKTMFYNSYARTRSYFSNSIYEAKGLPQGAELAILNKFKDKLAPEVFTTEYNPPKTDGSGNNRDNLKKAQELLKQAGWEIKEGKLQNAKGEVFTIEFLLESPTFERVVEPYTANLKRLGIQANTRTIDPVQYQKRIEQFDFDVIVKSFGAGQIPGNELMDMLSSKSADTQGSGNDGGLKNEVVDALIEMVVKAQSKQDLLASVMALDRVLQNGHYVIPHWNITKFRLIYWDKFGMPERAPKYSVGIGTWWSKEVDKPEAAASDATSAVQK